MPTFQELADKRRALQVFCRSQNASVTYFSAGLSFYLDTDEKSKKKISTTAIKHKTSSITCYEALLRYSLPSENDELAAKAISYCNQILQQKQAEWMSDESARVYCRCRALPFAIKHTSKWTPKISAHIKHIFHQLQTDKTRFAIGEADPNEPKDNWYKPNAYHTYWTLELLQELKNKFEAQYESLDRELDLERYINQMNLWAQRTMAVQIALHTPQSSTLDTDQLAWAIAIFLRKPSICEARLDEQDLLKRALEALFSTQTDVGAWQHYGPLFHYRSSGNAYSYVFESFSEIIRHTLAPNSSAVRMIFRDHFEKLMKLADYADQTRISVTGSENKSIRIWSSGHRMGRTHAESWATASVFSFAQAMRQLVGIWCRDEALKTLPQKVSPASANLAKLEHDYADRINTWTLGTGLADRLYTLFINPVRYNSLNEAIDPDTRLIHEHHARSAILFGPPGASKTYMASNLAALIGWQYVEIHSSHFVAEGLSNAQKTADGIFRRLGELDHTVVLLDEIDELVRERDVAENNSQKTDTFGRFLTTSMLPRLAELWENRKVIYFVATNHIEFFDEAIIRAQRFDAVWFVSPPSFEAKMKELKRLLAICGIRGARVSVKEKDINKALDVFLPHKAGEENNTEAESVEVWNPIAKFALLRWDEMAEVAARLRDIKGFNGNISKSTLSEALTKLQDGSRRSKKAFTAFVSGKEFERRDFNKTAVWVVEDVGGVEKVGRFSLKALTLNTQIQLGRGTAGLNNERAMLSCTAEDFAELCALGVKADRVSPGVIKLRKAAGQKASSSR